MHIKHDMMCVHGKIPNSLFKLQLLSSMHQCSGYSGDAGHFFSLSELIK